MRDFLSVHRYLPAILAVLLSIWYGQSFADTLSPTTLDAVAGIGSTSLPAEPADLWLPEAPRTADSPIGPIKDDRDDDAAWESGRHDSPIDRSPPRQVSPALFIPLPSAPAVASNAFRLFPIYRATQRFRL